MVMMKRAAQLTARKSVSIAEAGLSDVRRTDSGRLNQETVHVWHLLSGTVCHVCCSYIHVVTAIRPLGVMMLSWST
jgi:hypothetical protein